MTATPMHELAIGAATGGVLRSVAPAVLARSVAVLEDRTSVSSASLVRAPRLAQAVRSC